MTALKIADARKTYANGFTALHGVDFEVNEGEFFALLGPNGAGKTTLISAMAGLSRLSSGDIWVMGHHVERDAYAARMNLGVVPQELVFDPFFTVREALRFQSGYFGIRHNDDWIDEILANLGLADKAETNTRRLSGGMKRRVMVAQAMVHRPPVIVLDEPTAGVDVELRQSLWAFMRSLNQAGHTIVLTTHYLEEAEEHCHRVAVLKQGRLVALDETRHLLQNGRGVRVLLRTDQTLPEAFSAHIQSSDSPNQYVLAFNDFNALSDGIARLRQCGIGIADLAVLENDLEHVFLQLTGESQ